MELQVHKEPFGLTISHTDGSTYFRLPVIDQERQIRCDWKAQHRVAEMKPCGDAGYLIGLAGPSVSGNLESNVTYLLATPQAAYEETVLLLP